MYPMAEPKDWFHGKGPFSSINVLTTRIKMIEAVERYGLGGDSLAGEIRRKHGVMNAEMDDFAQGVRDSQLFASDPGEFIKDE
jgi:hypothetical protein